jgi:hypothetical protein
MRTLLLLAALAACGASPKPVTNQQPPPPPAVPPAAGDPKAVCAKRPDMFGPFELDAAQARARYGLGAKHYADAPTTKDKAIEVCGVGASLTWLMDATCANGSPAFKDGADAHESRSGSVGGGGRCGAIIDLYVAKCPEREYEIYIDMYMCGPGETFLE